MNAKKELKARLAAVQKEEDSWESFHYQVVSYPWFAEEDRPKTMTALQKLCERMPVRWKDKLPLPLIVFAPSPNIRGEAMAFSQVACSVDQYGAFIYLSPELERNSQRRVDNTVAHEFAHVVLGHHRHDCQAYLGKSKKFLRCKTKDLPGEKAADALIVKWGFGPAYCRRKS